MAAGRPLETYRRKRDFRKTAEPRGRARRRAAEDLSFVVQKHDATRLHFDFRLELDGVLLSWAVPKGPSLDPEVSRLAIHVEDHPLDYASFEGVIPAGEYGGGPVIVWDRGVWRPHGDPRAGHAKGHLSFDLEGERLAGGFALVRIEDRGNRQDSWLLKKAADGHARPGSDDAVVVENPTSVATGRTLARLTGRAEDLPEKVSPQLATLVEEPPAGDGWLHEMKLDGYRLMGRREAGKVTLLTRRGEDWTKKLAALAADVAALPGGDFLLDGELVFLRPDGTSDFGGLQAALGSGREGELVWFVFDALFLDGVDRRDDPLVERKEALAAAIPDEGRVRFLRHVEGHGGTFFGKACQMGLEGVVSKRRDARYSSRRTRTWLKSKCARRETFRIGGWLVRGGGLASILVGERTPDGALRFRGKVGTGFSQADRKRLAEGLAARERDGPPFSDPPRAGRGETIRWSDPDLAAEIVFTEITDSGRLRHPSFHGLAPERLAPVAGARGVRLSNPEKVLWPEMGVTKGGMAAYYDAVADRMIAGIAGRPLTLYRCPGGRHEGCFFQKHATAGMPDSIRRVPIREGKGTKEYVAVDTPEGLLALVQLGVLEIHPWGSRADRLERPDRVVFDVDPDVSLGFAAAVSAAEEIRDRLDDLGLVSFVRTTGGKGLHVVLPLVRRHDFAAVKSFAKDFAVAMERDSPDRYVSVMTKSKRKGKVFVDYLRNGRGATAVASWSTRARPGATVATPLAWDELTPTLAPTTLNVETAPARPDPWPDLRTVRQSLTAPLLRKLKRR